MRDDAAPAWALEMTQTLGEIKGSLTALNTTFTQHVVDDKVLSDRIGAVERKMSWQAGATRVWSLVASAAASVGGALLVHIFEKHK